MGSHHGEQFGPYLRSSLRTDRRLRLELEQARAYGVPHSILLGRPWPQPGEPLFTQEDTDAAVALAEEERDSCPACGMPKAWCREAKDGRARFEVDESWCWATWRLAVRQNKMAKEKVDPAGQRATQMTVKFRRGYEPDVAAGLGLDGETD